MGVNTGQGTPMSLCHRHAKGQRRHGLLVISLSLMSVLCSGPAVAADSMLNAWLAPVAQALSSVVFFSVPIAGTPVPLVVVWLVAAAIFFTLYFRFLNIRGFIHAIRIVSGGTSNQDAPGEVSHFQALSTAVSGTVGIGNIAGVAIAISVGGPGATFWMFVAGLLGMSTKFVECTLGALYRRENPDGSVSGGPMYYLQRALSDRHLPNLGRVLGGVYALGIVVGCLGIGNMFQSNQAYRQVVAITGGESGSWLADRGWLFGMVLALAVGLVIIGGIKSIAKVTSKVVPFMALFYCIGALVVITLNAEALPFALGAIVSGAFDQSSVAGGLVGVMVIGFQRAVFSNEAGIGSASIAHAAVCTREPITEGFVALLEPFIDTVVICTLTALVIVTTLYYEPEFFQGLGGIEMTSLAFQRRFEWAPIFIAIAGFLFAFSTMIAWAYYGLKGWTYLVGEGRAGEFLFKLFFCFCVALGCTVELQPVLDFSDALVFFICVPNVVGLYLLAPTVRRELDRYLASLNNP